MTENTWQQTSNPSPEYGTGSSTGSAAEGSPSAKAGAAKDEAGAVAGEAAGKAKHVTETAAAEVSHVVSEVKSNVKDLLHQATSDLKSQAGAQQQKAAAGVRKISEELRTMADAPEEQGVASDVIRQVAERSASVASWLEDREPGSVLTEVKSFARRRPGAFLLIAAGTGMLSGRLGKSLQAGAPSVAPVTGTTDSPLPVHHSTESSITAGIGAPFYEESPAAVPVYVETVQDESTRPGFDGLGPAGVPLRDPEDPFAVGGGHQL